MRPKQVCITARGLDQDRIWMCVEAEPSPTDSGPAHTFISARKDPNLLQIQATPTNQGVRLERPGANPLHVSLPDHQSPVDPKSDLSVCIWGGVARAPAPCAKADAWVSNALGRPARLVYAGPSFHRPINPNIGTPSETLTFVDGGPILLVGQTSLDDLNSRLSDPVSLEHFRPNLVVGGSEPYAEDEWTQINIGPVQLIAGWPCARCVLVTRDPATGLQSPLREPLRTLATYRTRDQAINFGMNVRVKKGGVVKLGDPVQVFR